MFPWARKNPYVCFPTSFFFFFCIAGGLWVFYVEELVDTLHLWVDCMQTFAFSRHLSKLVALFRR